MDATALARRLLGPIPVHVTVGLEVLSAVDGRAEVRIGHPSGLTNVIGALHSSGLVTLIDAAGLAAMIAAAEDNDAFVDVSALGAAASLTFHRPARGAQTAVRVLDDDARDALRPVFARASVTTSAEILDSYGGPVCAGQFQWSLRRRTPGVL